MWSHYSVSWHLDIKLCSSGPPPPLPVVSRALGSVCAHSLSQLLTSLNLCTTVGEQNNHIWLKAVLLNNAAVYIPEKYTVLSNIIWYLPKHRNMTGIIFKRQLSHTASGGSADLRGRLLPAPSGAVVRDLTRPPVFPRERRGSRRVNHLHVYTDADI